MILYIEAENVLSIRRRFFEFIQNFYQFVIVHNNSLSKFNDICPVCVIEYNKKAGCCLKIPK